jgi:CO/xanthine dehydrogenase Mo-binding subunit
VGEPPVIAAPAAIANAVADATGLRFTALPITPEAVVRALGRAP